MQVSYIACRQISLKLSTLDYRDEFVRYRDTLKLFYGAITRFRTHDVKSSIYQIPNT